MRSARARLADDLGIDIGDRLRALESSMLRQDPALAPTAPPHRVSDTCPYRGLQPFSPADTEDFFGRDADIEAMRQRVREGSLTVVVGASGSGKSSLVLAGLLPRIADGRRTAVITAGREAASALRATIDAGGPADIVVVDQAEAILQLPERERDELCRIVAEALAGGSIVLMTLRSDFLDRATGLPRIGALIGRAVYAIGPLDTDGLREAIEGPAARAGLRLEPGLVEVIVRDAADRRTTLPHVSHALEETWVRREGATLTVAGYEASGGITGAIAQSAETLYRSLDAHDAAACRSLMLRLVHRGADGASVRRTAALAPLVADPAWRGVLNRLVAARLLTTDGDEVTVAHEALATAWPRLDQWLEEDAEGARLVATVSTAAELWNGSGRRNDDLLRGARLQAALDWRDGSEPELTTVEREFLDASAEREQDEIRELARRAARDKRVNRWLRWAMAGAGVLLIAAIFGGALAAVRGGEAGRAAEDARIEALVATSLSLLDNDRETAALLAAETYRRWPDDPRTRSALWGVMTSTAGLVDMHHDRGALYPSMDMLPDTGTALRVSSNRDSTGHPAVEVVDVATGDVLRTFELGLPATPPGWSRTVEVSADGSVAAIQSPVYPDPSNTDECCWAHLTFLDLSNGKPLPSTGLVRSPMSGMMTLDPAGRTLYVAETVTADIIAVDTATGEVRSSAAAFDAHPKQIENVHGVALVGDGLVAVGAGNQLRLYDRATLALTRTIPLEGDVSSMDVIADGRGGVVTTGWDGTVRVSLATGETLWRRFPDPTRNCYSLYLATDTTVACGSYEGVALVDLATGETRRAHAALQLNQLPRFERIDGGTLLVAVSQPPTWMRWRIDGGGTDADVVAKGRELVNGPEAGGSLVVTQPVGGGRMRLWDLKRDAPVGEEADLIIPLGSGVVARYARYDPEERSGEPRLERRSTGETIPLRIPGVPKSFNVLPGGWDAPAFAWWPQGIVAFDPSTGTPLGPIMRVPDSRLDVRAASETPDATLAVVTWAVDQARSETGVFDIPSGRLLVRGLHDLESSLVLDDDQFIGVAASYARRYDIHTLKPLSALARAIGGSQLTSVSTDGRTLLNVGFNNALTLYDLTADIALASPVDSDASGVRLRGGYLTADGETLLEALPDGIRVWDLRVAEQALRACELAGRELSEEEWATYFPGEGRVGTCAGAGG
ncbi:nSTAND1 domain-containing NTPase [Leifsonia williamsii]|uniref:nSTAND1 domain-containing NTPase n=1 Tax=Leifsonia williamsii TaxID=3035919 RepID=UPI003435FC36